MDTSHLPTGKSYRHTFPQAGQPLTSTEQAIFYLFGSGLITKEIARARNCAPKTIDKHRENIRVKLSLRAADLGEVTKASRGAFLYAAIAHYHRISNGATPTNAPTLPHEDLAAKALLTRGKLIEHSYRLLRSDRYAAFSFSSIGNTYPAEGELLHRSNLHPRFHRSRVLPTAIVQRHSRKEE